MARPLRRWHRADARGLRGRGCYRLLAFLRFVLAIQDFCHRLKDALQQFQRLFVGVQGDRKVRLCACPGGDAAVEGHQQTPDHGHIQVFQIQHDGVLLLGHLVHAHSGGLHPRQRDIDQIADRGRRVAVAVDELVQHIGGILGGLDGRDPLVGFNAARPVGNVRFGPVTGPLPRKVQDDWLPILPLP